VKYVDAGKYYTTVVQAHGTYMLDATGIDRVELVTNIVRDGDDEYDLGQAEYKLYLYLKHGTVVECTVDKIRQE